MTDNNQTVYLPDDSRKIKEYLRNNIISQLTNQEKGKFGFVIDDPNWICAKLLYNMRIRSDQNKFGTVFFINYVPEQFHDQIESVSISNNAKSHLARVGIILLEMKSNDFLTWFHFNYPRKKLSFVWYDGVTGLLGNNGGMFSSPETDLSYLFSNNLIHFNCKLYLTLNNSRHNAGKAAKQFSAFCRRRLIKDNFAVKDRNYYSYADREGRGASMVLVCCQFVKIIDLTND